MGKVIISLSAGTALLIVLLSFSLCAAIVTAGYYSKNSPHLYTPHEGVKGALERLKNEIDYGPVNMTAAKEIKNGFPLFDRIRANRQARSQPQQCTQATQAYSYTIATPQAIEYLTTQAPAAIPIDGCKDGTCKPRTGVAGEAVKTGAFICSNCRKQIIADWHTEWKEDGTPETYLCKTCYGFMNHEQRHAALVSYQSRQFKSAGVAGLLHPESAN